jgi:hypothetical protein
METNRTRWTAGAVLAALTANTVKKQRDAVSRGDQMRSSMHRTICRMLSCRGGLVAVGVVLLFASPSHVAQAQKPGRPIAVHAQYTEHFETTGAQCNTESRQCELIMGGLSTYTGGIAGDERFSCTSEGLPADGKLRYSCHAKFLAPTKVAGCGTGTFSITGTNGETDLTAPDPATGTYPGKGDWVVDAGSGTGDLRRLNGAGHIVWHLALTGAGYGDVTGTVTC